MLKSGSSGRRSFQLYGTLLRQVSGASRRHGINSWGGLAVELGARYVSAGVALYANAGSSFVAPSAKSVGGTLGASDAGVPGGMASFRISG